MPQRPEFRLPNTTQHTVIVGRNGTGKTQFASWLLSKAPLDKMPFIVIDYKHEGLFGRIRRIRPLELKDQIPREPGLYIARPQPHQHEATEQFLWRVWQRGRVGLYFDEGYHVPDEKAFPAIFTSGRSKHVPTITLVQRPSWISRFVFSEASFYAVFHLNDARDEKIVEQILPRGALREPRPPFHALWYDVGQNLLATINPVPPADEIVHEIEARIAPRRIVA